LDDRAAEGSESTEGTELHSTGFRPVADAESRVLILGTLPGPESLRQRKYYARKGNAFWPIMERLFGAGPDLAYRERLQVLRNNGIALWDICHTAYREGALDAAIDLESVVPNDFVRFLKAHPRIHLICFNGQQAEKLFRRRVLPGLPQPAQLIPRTTLPSTSPAHAAMRFEEKHKRWRIIKQACGQRA
jgi:double-stranded uracil-DNA glycosylase